MVFKTKELSNALEKQLKKLNDSFPRESPCGIIKSEKHQIGSYVLDKISLSCFDDKRYIHKNGVTSYAYGHNKL